MVRMEKKLLLWQTIVCVKAHIMIRRTNETGISPRPMKSVEAIQAFESERPENFDFDPERDISPETQEAIFKYLAELRENGHTVDFFRTAANFFVVFPSRARELKPTDEEFKFLNRDLGVQFSKLIMEDERVGMSRTYDMFSIKAVRLLSVCPERRSEMRLDDVLLRQMIFRLETCHSDFFAIQQFFSSLVCADVMFPNKILKPILTEGEVGQIKDLLNIFRNENRPASYYELIANICVVFPDLKEKLELTESDFHCLLDKLQESCANEEWYHFGGVARNLVILSAERAGIDSQGKLIITRKKKQLVRNRRPLPERLRI